MKAQILTGGKLECGGSGSAGQQSSGLTFMANVSEGAGTLTFSATKSGSSVDQTFMQMDEAAGGVSAMHFITAEAAAGSLTAADDLSSATVKGASPFISGTAEFSGESMGSMATGTTAGDLVAKFDSIGTKTIPSGTDALLQKR
jgi:hypothetical protein